jgi:hypothetical protein
MRPDGPFRGPFPFPELRRRAESLPRELRLVAFLSRGRLAPGDRPRLETLLKESPSWHEVLRLARRHRLEALVARHLPHLDEAMPEDIRETLVSSRRDGAALMLRRSAQLLEMLCGFRRCGIPAVPYKGPALAVQLYGDPCARPPGDLDVLVRPGDVLHARRALEDMGYRPRHPLEPGQLGFMIRKGYHQEFVRPDGAWVELHWAFTGREFPFGLQLDDLLPRLRTVRLGGHPLPAIPPEELLLVLCVHGAKHRWDHLEWLAGVAELLRITPELDEEKVLTDSARLGARRTLHLGLALAGLVLDGPVPEGLAGSIRSDRAVEPLALQVLDLLLREPTGWAVSETVRRDRFRTLLRERRRDRVLSLWHRATTPSDPERWEVASVAGRPLALHALRRPFRVARRLGGVLRGLPPLS